MSQNGKIAKGLLWNLAERFGVLGTRFVLQLVLARMLGAEPYGVLSLMIVFTSLASVIIENGLNNSLIQNKDVTEEDYSSVFWVTMAMSTGIYGLLFLSAPAIAAFYKMPEIVVPFRVLSLMLFPGALNSVQMAIIRRNMDFRKIFTSNFAAILTSGTIGIAMAYMGAGLWALVAQSFSNTFIACLVMWFTVRWRPRLVCNMARVKVLFSYGWKLLVSGLLETFYQDLRSLVIGKKYDSGTLGYHNQGKQFPHFIIGAINDAVQRVLLPAMAAEQDDQNRVKNMTRSSVMLSSYVIFPMMAGLAGVATPLVRLLLTDKWLSCVPFLQIYCFTYAFYPVHTSNLQAIKAVGRSDIFLKLELIKKSYDLVLLVVAMFVFDSPLGIAMTGAATGLISCFVNASPNKKLIGYSYAEQIRDILPSFAASLVMCAAVLAVGMLELPTVALLAVQVVTGVAVYVALSAVFRLKPYRMLLEILKKRK